MWAVAWTVHCSLVQGSFSWRMGSMLNAKASVAVLAPRLTRGGAGVGAGLRAGLRGVGALQE